MWIKGVPDLMVGPPLKSFRSLQLEFDISSKDLYTYLQLTHILWTRRVTAISLPWFIKQFYYSPSAKTKGISLFYLLLNNKDVFSKSSSMVAWEKEIGIEFTSDQWCKAYKVTYAATKCVNLWELTHKIALRWYLTPYRIAKFAPSSSALCRRKCGEVGTLFHTMWSINQILGVSFTLPSSKS